MSKKKNKNKRDNYAHRLKKESKRKKKKAIFKKKKEEFYNIKRAEQFELKNVVKYKEDFSKLADAPELTDIQFNDELIERAAKNASEEFLVEFQNAQKIEEKAASVLKYRIDVLNQIVAPGFKKKILKKIESAAKRTHRDGDEEGAEVISQIFGYVQKRAASPGENLFIRILFERRTSGNYHYPESIQDRLTEIDTHLDKIEAEWIEEAHKKEEARKEKELAKAASEETKEKVEEDEQPPVEEPGTVAPAEEKPEPVEEEPEAAEEQPETIQEEEETPPPEEMKTEEEQPAEEPPAEKKSFFKKLFGFGKKDKK